MAKHLRRRTPTRLMQLRVPEELHTWLKEYAFVNKTTMTNIVTAYLTRLRDRKESPMKVPEV